MTKDNQDELVRAYATLTALRKNIDKINDYHVEETCVNEFHTVLDKLKNIGIDVDEFRIPDSAMKRKPGVSIFRGGEKISSSEGDICVVRSFILTKLDAILGYFRNITRYNI